MLRLTALSMIIATTVSGCALAGPENLNSNEPDKLFFTEVKELNEANAPNFAFLGRAEYPVYNSNGVALARFSLSAENIDGAIITHGATVNPFNTNGWEQPVLNLITNIKADAQFKDIVLPYECPVTSLNNLEAYKPATPDIDGNYNLSISFETVPKSPGMTFEVAPLSVQSEPVLRVHLTVDMSGSGGDSLALSYTASSNNWDDLVISCGAYANAIATSQFIEIP